MKNELRFLTYEQLCKEPDGTRYAGRDDGIIAVGRLGGRLLILTKNKFCITLEETQFIVGKAVNYLDVEPSEASVKKVFEIYDEQVRSKKSKEFLKSQQQTIEL